MKVIHYPILTTIMACCAILASSVVIAKTYDMESIMKDGFKGDGSLFGKLKAGSATAEEKKELLEMFVSLQGHSPSKGDAASWKEKTTTLKDAMQAFVDGKGDVEAVKKAANCKACHDVHRE